MLAVVWSLAAAALYGLSDYLSGVQSRRRSYLWVGFVALCVSAACALGLALFSGTQPTARAVGWGVAGALGQAAGTLFLMRGLARAAMHVAGPVSAVFGAGIPVLVGVLQGERPAPLVLAGLVAALPAVWLVASGERGSGTGGALDGVLAGLGFGLFFCALAQNGPDAGPWPVAVCLTAAAVLVGAAVLARRPEGSFRAALPAWTVGATGFAASTCYVAASHAGLLAVVAVVTSLYPAVTVLLAMALLGERASRLQLVGLALSALAVAAIAHG